MFYSRRIKKLQEDLQTLRYEFENEKLIAAQALRIQLNALRNEFRRNQAIEASPKPKEKKPRARH